MCVVLKMEWSAQLSCIGDLDPAHYSTSATCPDFEARVVRAVMPPVG